MRPAWDQAIGCSALLRPLEAQLIFVATISRHWCQGSDIDVLHVAREYLIERKPSRGDCHPLASACIVIKRGQLLALDVIPTGDEPRDVIKRQGR